MVVEIEAEEGEIRFYHTAVIILIATTLLWLLGLGMGGPLLSLLIFHFLGLRFLHMLRRPLSLPLIRHRQVLGKVDAGLTVHLHLPLRHPPTVLLRVFQRRNLHHNSLRWP